MSFLSILTLILVVLKLVGVLTWSWFLVLLPLGVEIMAFLIAGVAAVYILWRTR